jgi:CheY-like chemotaxis protein
MMRLDGEAIHQSEEITPLHLIEAGGRTALVCIADGVLSERIAQALQKLNYHVVVAQNPSSLLGRMEFDQYPLILLDEGYGGTDSASNPVLLHLQRSPMPARRKSFLCVLSEQTPTLDHLAAFRIGANLIINLQDVEKMPVILDRLVKEYEAFYAVFNDELTKRGTSSV